MQQEFLLNNAHMPLLATVKYIAISMRPRQWTKNIVLFIALLFSQNLFNPRMLLINLAAFSIFCLLSGGIYILNDLFDIEEDKKHPDKSKRPISAGNLSPIAAKAAMTIVLLFSIISSFFINIQFAVIAIIYIGIQIAYSLYIKHVIILDVFTIAAGFFLRVVAGAHAILVPISTWLVVCTFFLSLFLALCKRRHEIVLLEGQSSHHRRVLKEYGVTLIDQMVAVITSATVISYSLYTLSEETVKKFHTTSLIYTIPFIVYGIYRYLYLVYQQGKGGSPEILLLTDKPLIIDIILFALVTMFIIYLPKTFAIDLMRYQ